MTEYFFVLFLKIIYEKKRVYVTLEHKTTKVISRWGIFVAIAKNKCYR